MDFSIKAVFGLVTTSVRTELRELRKEVNDFATSWGKIGLAAAGAAFVALAKGALDLAASLKNASGQIGINVESLQALNFIATQNGSSQEQMQKALEKTRLFMQKAREGSESHREALSKLGISAENIAALPLERKFEAIAKAYATAKDKGAAYNAVSEIFGEKIGPKMVQSLEDLATRGFDEAAKSAAKAGHIMSAETIVALESAQQAIEDFKKRATIAVGNIIVNFRTEEGLKLVGLQILKVLGQFGAGIVDAIAEGGNFFYAFFGSVGVWLRERVQNALVSAAQAFGTALNQVLPEKFQINLDGLEKLKLASEDFGEILARVISETEPLNFRQTVTDTYDEMIAKQQAVVDAVSKVDLKPAADNLRNAGKDLETGVKSGATELVSAGESVAEGIEAAAEKLVKKQKDAAEEAARKLREAAVTWEQAFASFGQQMKMIITRWPGMDRNSPIQPLGARGSAQFESASDEALAQIVYKNRQLANQLRHNGQPLSANYDNRMEAGRLEIEANNAERELNLRNSVRRAYQQGGVDGVYRALPDRDPLILDRLIDQFAKQLPESVKTANSLERIERGLKDRGFLPPV